MTLNILDTISHCAPEGLELRSIEHYDSGWFNDSFLVKTQLGSVVLTNIYAHYTTEGLARAVHDKLSEFFPPDMIQDHDFVCKYLKVKRESLDRVNECLHTS